jgi:hypothetical protein
MVRLRKSAKGWVVAAALLALTGCGGGEGGDQGESPSDYKLHGNITSTVFWVGEEAGAANGGIANLSSVWDDIWMESYGGVDDPDERDGYRPRAFVPRENPFYAALPFNDFDEEGRHKPGLARLIPWVDEEPDPGVSVCKNRWIEIEKNGKKAYAQWEDAGPFGEDDREYVFGEAAPKNSVNDHAGIDLSPAVRDYLGLEDIDRVSWRFVDESEVPDGPWKTTVTRSQVRWVEWYHPEANVSWQWQLQGDLNLSVDATLWDVDLFDTDRETIASLKASGRRVLCYFSAGSWEEWRPDAREFPEEAKGEKMEGWDELWLDIRHSEVRRIMRARLDLAREKGCDGVEPDNVDGYTNETGFDLTAADQSDYNRFLALEAHSRGLAIALKNDLDQVEELLPFFDLALNEQCHEYDECGLLAPFTRASKPVLNAEYAQRYRTNENGARDELCRQAREEGLRTLVLPVELDGSYRFDCGH